MFGREGGGTVRMMKMPRTEVEHAPATDPDDGLRAHALGDGGTLVRRLVVVVLAVRTVSTRGCARDLVGWVVGKGESEREERTRRTHLRGGVPLLHRKGRALDAHLPFVIVMDDT